MGTMEFTELILPIGASILVGALIGLEREKARQVKKGVSAIGIRTDILICLFGAIAAFLGKTFHPLLFILSLGAMLALIVASYIYISITKKRIGVTTEISTILVFLLGAMTMFGYMQLAIAIAIIITLILSLRDFLHRAVININSRELFDTIKFAIIAFIILPFLPNQNYDGQIFNYLFPNTLLPSNFSQIDILNPYRIWFLVVLVSGISFLGYILVKTIGRKKGIGITGLIGGLYSSTATSLSLAHKSKLHPEIRSPFVTGIVLACGISFLRTFIELRALNAELFTRTLIPISMMFIYLMITGFYLLLSKKQEHVEHRTTFKTPFELKEAFKLGGYIIGALLLAKIILSYVGINLFYVVAALMAFFAIDDPVIISAATSAGKLMSNTEAKNVILLVLTLNMVQKVGMMYVFGNRKLVKQMAVIFGGLVLVSIAGFLYF